MININCISAKVPIQKQETYSVELGAVAASPMCILHNSSEPLYWLSQKYNLDLTELNHRCFIWFLECARI
ncbi:hypothetical protein BDA96_02G103100 [Sorghum bicolor]|uniref:Uncharacterized protein n=2 Tax=Sorghum bicolor TaxID=4558 RepID=A0A921US11_SORBI|nr:hypothetical protein BDA96_08G179200 [Sorghum bicolor]KAG0542427.1 hypothetical protein BDA96_02G103100 [Sorghum bicolor]OQU88806.1 hypothetical protein SORBI_3002G099350 [Sorghum bicolor]